MGEAKRRKKLDPNFGKIHTPMVGRIYVKNLRPDSLDSERKFQSYSDLTENNRYHGEQHLGFLKGEIHKNNLIVKATFEVFTMIYEGQDKLYARTLIESDSINEDFTGFSQEEIDDISKQVCKNILQKNIISYCV